MATCHVTMVTIAACLSHYVLITMATCNITMVTMETGYTVMEHHM